MRKTVPCEVRWDTFFDIVLAGPDFRKTVPCEILHSRSHFEAGSEGIPRAL